MSLKNSSALLHHMMDQKRKQDQIIRKALRPISGKMEDRVSDTDEDESVQMTETRIYIGLNDAETREQIYETEVYTNILKEVCRNYQVAFSMDIEEGGYYHEDGEYTEENSLVLDLIDVDRDIVRKIAKDLRERFHQESVLVTEGRIDGYFIV